MNHNLILDFTGVYSEIKEEQDKFQYIDCTDIPETDMYCSREAEQMIKNRIRRYGPSGIHFLDSGNYHYVTKFFVEEIEEPFSLVLFDYHDDMGQAMLHDLTSCGSWAREILFHNPYLKQLIIIGPDQKQLDEAGIDTDGKLLCVSIQELESEKAKEKMRQIDTGIPVYISIDKDVLSKSYAVTNWNQGKMSLEMLKNILTVFLVMCQVIGVDICGEYSFSGGAFSDYVKAEKVNKKADKALFDYIYSFIEE